MYINVGGAAEVTQRQMCSIISKFSLPACALYLYLFFLHGCGSGSVYRSYESGVRLTGSGLRLPGSELRFPGSGLRLPGSGLYRNKYDQLSQNSACLPVLYIYFCFFFTVVDPDPFITVADPGLAQAQMSRI